MSDSVDATIQRFARTEVDEDDARYWEREVYKYYCPLETLYRVTENYTSVSDIRASPDRSLTAFAQLGALRLNCRRVLISLLDRRYQYVIAEATRTYSLPKDTVDDENDNLWFGVSQFTRFGAACCEYAAGLVPAIPGASGTLPVSGEVLVVPDLREDARFAREPYVTGGPLGRFYAGAPIMSPDNLPIGSYCILDDKPRPSGLTGVEIDFLKDMTVTVMQHLEILRTKVELRRCQNMVTGLGDFIAGMSKESNSNFKHSRPNSPHASLAESSPTVQTSTARLSDESGESTSSQASWRTAQASPSTNLQLSGPGDCGGPVSDDQPREPLGQQSENPVLEQASQSYSSVNKSKEKARNNLQEESLSDGVHVTFKRAADIIRPAVDLDGAVFLDASIGTFGGMVEKPHGEKVSRANTKVDSPDDEDDKPCLCLGRSTVKRSKSSDFPESLLRALLDKYPKGKIWNFEDSSSDADLLHNSADRGKRWNVSRKGSRCEERRLLQALIPGARSLAFIGMWDSHRERWFAGPMLWTCRPTRILSIDVELNYLIAFGQSIMSEVAALDTKMADLAKAAFISSISHEFRTPLHGIMGSADCLHTTALDPFQQSLLETVDICGKTLLDTFDSLLSYAKINYMTGANAKKRSGTTASKSDVLREGTIGVEDNVSVGKLAEEVVDIVFAGSEYMTLGSGLQEAAELEIGGLLTAQHAGAQHKADEKKQARNLSAINVSVNYSNPGSSQWIFQTQPGAWRRIILNLVGNAIKYTPKGFVSVRLEIMPITGAEEHQSNVSITVSDSGKGMSPAFLQSKLFSPFVQEDPLSPGTGLGMSIVKQIVDSMQGHINVMSKQDEGTKINVTIPLRHGTTIVSKASVLHTVPDKCEGFRLKILNNAISSGLDDAVWTFANICNKAFGLVTDSNAESGQDDLYVTSERTIRALAGKLPALFPKSKQYSRRALIVLCKDSASARSFKNLRVASTFFHVIACISQPFGPTKVAKSLAPCLDYLRNPREQMTLRPSGASTRIFPASAGATPLAHDGKDSMTAFPFGSSTGSRGFADTSMMPGVVSHHSSSSDPGIDNVIRLEPDILQYDTGNQPPNALHTAFMTGPQVHEFGKGAEPPLIDEHPNPDPSASSTLLRERAMSPGRRPSLQTAVSLQVMPQAVESGNKAGKSTMTEHLPSNQSFTTPLLEPKIRASALLVDDNPVNLKILSTYMTKHKRTFKLAENGLEALEAYKSAVPDEVLACPELCKGFVAFEHVFMDLNMPVMGGLVATRRIRAYENEMSLQPAKIVAVTGMASASAQQEAFASGIDLFMTKPVRLKEISQILEIK